MPFCAERIEAIIENALRRKLEQYNPEKAHKPFHDNLLGRDKMILFSVVHSLNTTMGMSIYESIAVEIASGHFDVVECQKKLDGQFTESAHREISEIRNSLSHSDVEADHISELARLKKVCQTGKLVSKKLTKVDLYLEIQNNCFAIDIKTAKPNIDGFEKQKEKMLEWMASILYTNPKMNVRTITAIPYNPSHPAEYDRWTLRGVVDISENGQLLVAEDFWNFLAGGEDVYNPLLECFYRVGRNMEWEVNRFVNKQL